MKHALAFSIFLVSFLCGCDSQSGGPDLSGVLDLHYPAFVSVTPESEEAVLQALQATQRDTLNLYDGIVGRDTISFSVYRSTMPLEDLVAPWGGYDSLIVKIYTNARCGQVHPGFTSGCIGTFGRHKAFGNSMEWTVRDWKDCVKGDTVCIEWVRQVGTITYYPGFTCLDTIFTTKPILRYTCD